MNFRKAFNQALGLLLLGVVTVPVAAAPKVVRLTPPSYLFSGAERAGSDGIMLARFLPGQFFDLQATLAPDAGQTIGAVQFLVDGKPVVGGKAETATTGLWKELPAGTTVASHTRSVSHAPPGRWPNWLASRSASACSCPRRSRAGIAASTGSHSPAPKSSTCPRATILRSRAMSDGNR